MLRCVFVRLLCVVLSLYSGCRGKESRDACEVDRNHVAVNKIGMGNYAFLTKSAQAKASNKAFDKKRKVYKEESDMRLTKEVAEYSEWNETTISNCQSRGFR